MEGKVAVLGDADFVMPFSALGADSYCVDQSSEQVAETAKRIVAGQYALVVVAENVAALAQEVFSDYQDAPIPCVVVVPFTTEPKGFATRALGRMLRMATGIDILQSS